MGCLYCGKKLTNPEIEIFCSDECKIALHREDKEDNEYEDRTLEDDIDDLPND